MTSLKIPTEVQFDYKSTNTCNPLFVPEYYEELSLSNDSIELNKNLSRLSIRDIAIIYQINVYLYRKYFKKTPDFINAIFSNIFNFSPEGLKLVVQTEKEALEFISSIATFQIPKDEKPYTFKVIDGILLIILDEVVFTEEEPRFDPRVFSIDALNYIYEYTGKKPGSSFYYETLVKTA